MFGLWVRMFTLMFIFTCVFMHNTHVYDVRTSVSQVPLSKRAMETSERLYHMAFDRYLTD